MWVWALGLGATALLSGLYARRLRTRERRDRLALEAARAAGLVEPPSLHPVIDDVRCIGCATCVEACPEGGVLGIVDGRAALIEPTRCIGHGACKDACPEDAIALVFGTAERGVDIPAVGPNFETNVPGLFIAGELGGMGLIRNAVEQGRQVIDSVRALGGTNGRPRTALDVLIVGAGPAGFSASLAAQQHGLRYRTVEQDSLGGAVAHYPRRKLVMTVPMNLPGVGPVRLGHTSKENLLELWQDVERRSGVAIAYGERVESIEPLARQTPGFRVTTTRGSYESRAVVLAIGRRGTPRKLGAPGEDLPKVTYRLLDPEQYRGQRVLVVGGGDSALEAACSLSDEHGTQVVLSYRGKAFSRAKPANRERVESAVRAGRLKVLLESQVLAVKPRTVRLGHGGAELELPNDAVIVCAGGILPTEFLRSVGVAVETKYGTA